jgi:hypothetical protein
MMISALILAYCLYDHWCHLPVSLDTTDGCNNCSAYRTPGTPHYGPTYCTLIYCEPPAPPRWWERK